MADENTRMSNYLAEDIVDNIDEVRTARGEYDSLDDRLDDIESGSFTPTQAQLAAINSGITSTDVEQITTNKNNILFVNQKVGVNLVNSASGSGTRWINVEVDLPAGTYTCGFSSLTGDDSGVSQVTFYGADYAIIQPERSQISKGNNVYVNNIVVTGTVKTIRIYAASDSTTSQNKGVSYTNLFVCKQEAWDASVGVQPYAMSNAELTNNISLRPEVLVRSVTNITATTTLEDTGVSYTIPSGAYVRITATARYGQSNPEEIMIWTGSSVFAHTVAITGDNNFALTATTLIGGISGATTAKIYARFRSANTNAIILEVESVPNPN